MTSSKMMMEAGGIEGLWCMCLQKLVIQSRSEGLRTRGIHGGNPSSEVREADMRWPSSIREAGKMG